MENRRIGFLFPKNSKAGKRYFSGKITVEEKDYQIVAFYSKSQSGVDYLSISLSKPREEYAQESNQGNTQSQEYSQKSSQDAPRTYQAPKVDQAVIDPDDLPF